MAPQGSTGSVVARGFRSVVAPGGGSSTGIVDCGGFMCGGSMGSVVAPWGVW